MRMEGVVEQHPPPPQPQQQQQHHTSHHQRATPRKRRGQSEDTDYGWYQDLSSPATQHDSDLGLQRLTGPPPRTEMPTYILEESISTQQLWHQTAGRRPKQPSRERIYFEQLLQENFARSEVDYSSSSTRSSNEALSEMSLTPTCSNSSGATRRRQSRTVLFRAESPFGAAVSKFFYGSDTSVSSVTIQIPRFRVVRTSVDVHAEYLVVATLDAFTYGSWKRHTEFRDLATKLDAQPRQFKNAIVSWRVLEHRKKLFRCLDRDYLSLKCWLLERFLTDVVYESATPDILLGWMGLQ